ncbi:BglII/BstYI family type II restriction endonuclease [Metabacillus sp. FJAT-52054]|uniref:BglII/BstYI family type II restriction endonuclease n=1 Tax=Metabacillus sediminis TaxID=3117746 RepID=A0ABZ2NJ78_9BACI
MLPSERWIQNNYYIDERRNGLIVIKQKYPQLWQEIKFALRGFRLYFDEVADPGGGKSPVTNRLESPFKHKGWIAAEFQERNKLIRGKNFGKPNEQELEVIFQNSQTHEIDLFKGRVAIEIEWNNKHQFFSRDLETFNYLYNAGIIDVGIIITKHTSLHSLFKTLGYYIKKDSKGKPKMIADKHASTHTHTDKLYKLLDSNRCSCPLVIIGLTPSIYRLRLKK